MHSQGKTEKLAKIKQVDFLWRLQKYEENGSISATNTQDRNVDQEKGNPGGRKSGTQGSIGQRAAEQRRRTCQNRTPSGQDSGGQPRRVMAGYRLSLLGLDASFRTDASPERVDEAKVLLEERFQALTERAGNLSKERLLIFWP